MSGNFIASNINAIKVKGEAVSQIADKLRAQVFAINLQREREFLFHGQSP